MAGKWLPVIKAPNHFNSKISVSGFAASLELWYLIENAGIRQTFRRKRLVSRLIGGVIKTQRIEVVLRPTALCRLDLFLANHHLFIISDRCDFFKCAQWCVPTLQKSHQSLHWRQRTLNRDHQISLHKTERSILVLSILMLYDVLIPILT